MMHPTELGSRQAQFGKARRKRELCVRDTTLFFVLVFVFIFSQESGKAGIVTAILEMRNPNHRDVKCPTQDHTACTQRSWNSAQSEHSVPTLSNKEHAADLGFHFLRTLLWAPPC